VAFTSFLRILCETSTSSVCATWLTISSVSVSVVSIYRAISVLTVKVCVIIRDCSADLNLDSRNLVSREKKNVDSGLCPNSVFRCRCSRFPSRDSRDNALRSRGSRLRLGASRLRSRDSGLRSRASRFRSWAPHPLVDSLSRDSRN